MVVNTELTERRKRRMNRMLKSAHSASIEGIEFGRPRGPERSQILSLAESNWIDPYHSILIVGATEVGKTYIGCACKRGGPARGMRRSTCANRACTTKFLPEPTGDSRGSSPPWLAQTSYYSTAYSDLVGIRRE
jgi:hypothetical protein